MRYLALGLALVLALVGCDNGAPDGDSTATSVPSSSASTVFDPSDPGFPFVYPGPPVTYGTPLLEGTMHINSRSRCVTVTDSLDNVWIIAIPEESIIDMSDAANPTLTMEGCTPMHDGDTVQFGGGREGSEFVLDATYLERCGATGEMPWLVGYCVGISER